MLRCLTVAEQKGPNLTKTTRDHVLEQQSTTLRLRMCENSWQNTQFIRFSQKAGWPNKSPTVFKLQEKQINSMQKMGQYFQKPEDGGGLAAHLANPLPACKSEADAGSTNTHTSTGYIVSKANTGLRHVSTAKESVACESTGAKWSGSTGPRLHTTGC